VNHEQGNWLYVVLHDVSISGYSRKRSALDDDIFCFSAWNVHVPWICEPVCEDEVMSEGKKALERCLDDARVVEHSADKRKARQYVANLEAERDKLREAGNGLNELIKQAQKLTTMFLEPGEKRISTERELVSALIGHFDGPEQRAAQKAWKDIQP